ncbi:H-NS family nucleoid-associated regulatory protein [Qingshengfaniella alkalisoli]|uniref:H-NS histone family protein n=1 Tax=Qingshengfaniella alkalisoli TaxID=2599296 RepID=A0A5B8J7Z9_9RHOB|nr:H-NS histone family protein [Qingshengfaniella alkalisoli]QDY70607.1 H-NS histone family protein [Qingshengfaniella alkalisoli]
MTKIDLNKLSYAELEELQKNAQKAMLEAKNRDLDAVIEAAKDKAKILGVSWDDVVKKLMAAPAKGTAEVKYRHPEDPSLTWAGRGRKPVWLTKELSAGKALKDFSV